MFLRTVSPVVCLAYLAVWWASVALLARAWCTRFGRPRAWGIARRVAFVLVCVVGTVVWIWIDKRVELTVILLPYRKHGITVGDLLGAAPLIPAAMVVRG